MKGRVQKHDGPKEASSRSRRDDSGHSCLCVVLPRISALTLLIAMSGWIGCGVEKHYHILSRFFDGVPDPAIVKAGDDAVTLARRSGGVYFTHAPYANEQCESCHSMSGPLGGMSLSPVDSTSCLQCHEGVKHEHPFMHGPVVAGACLWCHSPHESTVKPLLRVSPQQLCVQCHGTSLGRPRSGNEIPEHSDPQRSCLDCHYGHGADNRAYLRRSEYVNGAQRVGWTRAPSPLSADD